MPTRRRSITALSADRRRSFAALSAELPQPGADNLVRIQVLPEGRFGTNDGRWLPADGLMLDRIAGLRIIERVAARETPLVVDYEHQTLHAEYNGQPAPAAGWFGALEWIDGQGLFAVLDLTDRAAQMVRDGEYKYFSPVVEFDETTGEVLALLMGALTNNPAIDGMAAAQWVAAASRRFTSHSNHPEQHPMDETLKGLIGLLGLPADTTRETALAALNAQLALATELRKTLALDATADAGQILAATAALSAQRADPARHVPVEQVNALRTEMTALSARLAARDQADVDASIEAALADGRLPKALQEWARELGKRDAAALSAYLAGAQPIAALSGGQTRTVRIDDQRTETLTDTEAEVCRRMGIAPAAFCAARQQQQQPEAR